MFSLRSLVTPGSDHLFKTSVLYGEGTMDLREAIGSVLALQTHYSFDNTVEMATRGDLIRGTIRNLLVAMTASLARAARLAESDVLIEGRDATGRKSEVPWVRFASNSRSPSATVGWYVVLLPRRDGAGVYLALAHGSAQFKGDYLVKRSDAELAKLVAWGRASLAEKLSLTSNLVVEVELAVSRNSIAKAYEKSCLAAFFYDAMALPDDSHFERDLSVMAELLGDLYEAERLGKTPLSESPEVRDAERLAMEISRPGNRVAGQGLALTSGERRAIELYAMAMAIAYLRSLGFQVTDKSSTESFDLLAERSGEVLKVEVKGTTGGLVSILLTANEVELHRQAYPFNALIVVHSIELTNRGEAPFAHKGELKAWLPWALNERRLRGVTFSYGFDDA
jgi:hypothetical protein